MSITRHPPQDDELAELRALWDAASVEPKMDPLKVQEDGSVLLLDVEYEHIATFYGGGLSNEKRGRDQALANARLVQWLLDHSWHWAEDGR